MSDLEHLTKEERNRVAFAKRNGREPCCVEVIIGWAEALNEARGKLAAVTKAYKAQKWWDLSCLLQDESEVK